MPAVSHQALRWMMAAAAPIAMVSCMAANEPVPPPSSSSPAPSPALPAALADAVRADAAKRGGAAPDTVRIERVEMVTWRDGSLGCPQPDRMYTQALVPGWRIAVTVGSQTLAYHASRRGGWLWCPAERAQAPLPGNAAI